MASSALKDSTLHDVMNVEQIKNSKLFKKFLESEQSDGNLSEQSSHRGFQESPFKKNSRFPQKQLEDVLKSSLVIAQSQKLNDNQRQSYQTNKGKKSQSPNPSESIQNLNISSASEQSRLNSRFQQNALQLSHSYFQPPTPNYNANSTQQTHTHSHSPELSNILNLSQRILDNPKKLQFSPERFYFNPPAIPSKKGNQTIVEEDTHPPTQVHTSNNSHHNFNEKMSSNQKNLQRVRTEYSQQQQQQQHEQIQFQYPIQQYQQQYRHYPENQGYLQQDQRNTFNQGQQQLGGLVRSLEYPNANREGEQENSASDQQQDSVEAGFQSTEEKIGGTNRKIGRPVNFSKTSKTTLFTANGEPKNFDYESIMEQMQSQEEQVGHIHLSLEKEQLKNQVLSENLNMVQNQMVSLDAEKAEIRTQLLAETEANSRQIQQQNQLIYSLQSTINELQEREKILRNELEKSKQGSFKEEALRQKLEDELKDAKNKILEQAESQQEYQRRQEKRDDEVIGLKLQCEQLKAKLATLNLNNERNSEKLSETQKQQFKEVEEKEESVRKIGDYQIKLQNYLVENERLKNETYSTARQLHDVQLRCELLQTDLNNSKQQLLEKSQKENTLQLQLDKATLDAFQLRSLFSKAEAELRQIKSAGLYQRPPQLMEGYENLVDQIQLFKNRASDGRNLASVEEEKSDASQPFAYRRGRFSNDQEEEVKVNSSYSRTRFKPQDNNIFGGGGQTSASRPGETSYSPGKRAEIVRPRDHNLFGGGVDDTYQPNPMKIGSSLSPNRIGGSTYDMPAAGVRRQPQQSGGNPILGDRQGRNDVETLERNISLMNEDKKYLEQELRKLEDMKRKTGADIRRKGEVSREIENLEKQISQQRQQMRMIQ